MLTMASFHYMNHNIWFHELRSADLDFNIISDTDFYQHQFECLNVPQSLSFGKLLCREPFLRGRLERGVWVINKTLTPSHPYSLALLSLPSDVSVWRNLSYSGAIYLPVPRIMIQCISVQYKLSSLGYSDTAAKHRQ